MATYKPNDMEMPNPPSPSTDTLKRAPDPDNPEPKKILPNPPVWDIQKVGRDEA